LEFLRGVLGEERGAAFLKELRKLFKIEALDEPVVLTYCKLYRILKRNGELIEDADLFDCNHCNCQRLISCGPETLNTLNVWRSSD